MRRSDFSHQSSSAPSDSPATESASSSSRPSRRRCSITSGTHLRRLGLLELDALTVTGEPLGNALDWWEKSERRTILRDALRQQDDINPRATEYLNGGRPIPHGHRLKATLTDRLQQGASKWRVVLDN